MTHPPELRETVIQRHRDGEALRVLARETGVPRSTIKGWIGQNTRAASVHSRRTEQGPIDDATWTEVLQLTTLGWTAAEIAERVGISDRTVVRIRAKGPRPVPTVRPKREWVDNARCRNDEPGLFFPSDTLHYARDVADAKNICNRCPVIDDCLAWAIDRSEHGIWGGTTDDERREMRRTA